MKQSYRTFEKNKKPNLQLDSDVSYGTSLSSPAHQTNNKKTFLISIGPETATFSAT
jgi:hypothetical protein